MHLCTILISLVLLAQIKAQHYLNANQFLEETLKKLSPEAQERLAAKIRDNLIKEISPRQEDEDEEESGLPDLFVGISKVVGSALSGNTTALVDSSASLLPPTVQKYITGALDVLVNTINKARPTEATTAKPTTKAPATEALKADSSSSPASTKTTDEDEDYEESTTTTPIVLRTNSSTLTSTTITPAKAESELLLQSNLDLDNKANWFPLIANNTDANNNNNKNNNPPLEDIDADNKANWVSLLGKTEKPAPPATPAPLPRTPAPTTKKPEPSRGNSKVAIESFPSQQRPQSPSEDDPTTGKLPSKLSPSLGQKFSSLLNANKPNLTKYNPDLPAIIKLQTFLESNAIAIKEKEWKATTITTNTDNNNNGKSTTKEGLFEASPKVNYASGFKYRANTTTTTTITTVTTSAPSTSTTDEDEDGQTPEVTARTRSTTEDDDDEDGDGEDNRAV